MSDDIKTKIIEQVHELSMFIIRGHLKARRARARGVSRTHQPSNGQLKALGTLSEQPQISQHDFGGLMGTSRQATAELLAKLEQYGYVTRTTSKDDRRVQMVQLTKAGRKVLEEYSEDAQRTTSLLDCLNEQELENLYDYLERINHAAEEQHPEDNFAKRKRLMRKAMAEFKQANEAAREATNESDGWEVLYEPAD